MKYEIEFEIQDLPKTYNAMGRSHWAVKAKEARKWKNIVGIKTSGRGPPNPLQRALLVLTRYSSKCPDPDGLVSSFKSTIDGLQQAGIIINDTFAVIGMPTYLWEKAPKGKGKIKVKIEEVMDGQN